MTNDMLSSALRFRPFAIATGLVVALGLPNVALAGNLPAPYVSRALDAVLIPVDASVREAFKLAADQKGVLVLAVSPKGVADEAGIAPGDVIESAHGRAVTDPITLDEIVYYWIKKDSFDFGFDGWHDGKSQKYTSTITLASYMEVIDVAAIASWSSYSYESFSYSEYTTEYSSEISESYTESETTIEETTSSEEFATEETTDEATSEETTTETTTEDATTTEDSTSDTATTDEAAPADDASGDEPIVDDAGGDSSGDAVEE